MCPTAGCLSGGRTIASLASLRSLPAAASASTSREDAGPAPTQGSFRPRLDQVDTSLQVQKGGGAAGW